MKKVTIITTFLIAISFFACEKDQIPQIVPVEIEFEIEKDNSDNDYQSAAVEVSDVNRVSHFQVTGDSASVYRQMTFVVSLANHEKINMGLTILGQAAVKDLVLGEILNLEHMSGLEWAYHDQKKEQTEFYENFIRLNLFINSNSTKYTRLEKNGFEITQIEEIMVNGVQKTYVESNFEGTLFGLYDPNGKHYQVYRIYDGVFKGVIE